MKKSKYIVLPESSAEFEKREFRGDTGRRWWTTAIALMCFLVALLVMASASAATKCEITAQEVSQIASNIYPDEKVSVYNKDVQEALVSTCISTKIAAMKGVNKHALVTFSDGQWLELREAGMPGVAFALGLMTRVSYGSSNK